MKKFTALAVLAFVAMTSLAVAGDEPWKEYTWEKGKCKILLPGAPQEIVSKGQPVETVLYLCTKGELACGVAYTEVPGLTTSTPELKAKALENGRDMGIKAIKGKQLSSKAIKLGDHPGLEFQAEFAGGLYWCKAYAIGDRAYQIIIAGPKEQLMTKEAEAFFESFKMTK